MHTQNCNSKSLFLWEGGGRGSETQVDKYATFSLCSKKVRNAREGGRKAARHQKFQPSLLILMGKMPVCHNAEILRNKYAECELLWRVILMKQSNLVKTTTAMEFR
jgi:hypothetical protein